MNKVLKTIMICLLSVSVLAILVLVGKLAKKLPKNPDGYLGNTSGNLQNNGLFVEDENYIYFANVSDSFKLCRMDKDLQNAVTLGEDSVSCLNLGADGSSVYYKRINYRMNRAGGSVYDISSTGIYRLNLKKKSLTRLFKDTSGSMLLYGNLLVFQDHGEDGDFDLYTLRIDQNKAKPKLLTKEPIAPVGVYGSALIYSDPKEGHTLSSIQPDTGSVSVYADVNSFFPVLTENSILFLSMSYDYALTELPFTDDSATLLTDERLCALNVSPDNRTIYYQVDRGEQSRICRYDRAQKKETTILEGNYKNLNTVSHYLFFTDFEEKICYYYDDNSQTVSQFLPATD